MKWKLSGIAPEFGQIVPESARLLSNLGELRLKCSSLLVSSFDFHGCAEAPLESDSKVRFNFRR